MILTSVRLSSISKMWNSGRMRHAGRLVGPHVEADDERLVRRRHGDVAQDRAAVDHYLRQPASGQWLLTTFESLAATMPLPSIGIGLPLHEIYAKVEFPPEE